jgi:ubiquinone/menaquinone biosynthesis C-methylase UbiE
MSVLKMPFPDRSKLYSDYDVLARIYQERWNQTYDDEGIKLLEKLVLQHLPKKAKILDLCCGNGNLIPPLLMKGYQVTGLDGSEELLRYACEKAPETQFILGDARFFEFPPTFHGVVSAGSSLNHVMNLEELKSVFHNVFAALLENGLFTFNLAMEEWYQSDRWNNTQKCSVKDDYIWIWQQSYDSEEKIGKRQITVMQLIEEGWQRLNYSLLSKIYSKVEIESTLANVGFTDVTFYDLERDLEVTDSLGEGIFVCRKPLN